MCFLLSCDSAMCVSFSKQFFEFTFCRVRNRFLVRFVQITEARSFGGDLNFSKFVLHEKFSLFLRRFGFCWLEFLLRLFARQTRRSLGDRWGSKSCASPFSAADRPATSLELKLSLIFIFKKKKKNNNFGWTHQLDDSFGILYFNSSSSFFKFVNSKDVLKHTNSENKFDWKTWLRAIVFLFF